ncbi:hypothetical protein ACJ5H2_00525 [Nocardioides sp. R1-1]|uniref:scabin-related ADP-ribosyltransferase n=1 Tax=Nocardioides sp. R1-1 TaxID=3383502 RepID=UPI0038D0CAFA
MKKLWDDMLEAFQKGFKDMGDGVGGRLRAQGRKADRDRSELENTDAELASAAPDLTGRHTDPVYRTSSELLYRSDNRPPDEIFADGFEVRDADNNDYDSFVRFNTPSNFVSTTKDPDLYKNWGSKYRYTVDAPGGIDADATIPDNPYGPNAAIPEREITFQGGIPAENVVGAHPVLPDNSLGEWIANPNYSGK